MGRTKRQAFPATVSKNMPANLPFGWEYEKVFGGKNGEGMPLKHKTLLKDARISFSIASAAIKQVTPAKMAQNGGKATTSQTLTLPQTATPFQLYLLIGLLAVFSAVLLAGMRLWWARR